MNKVILATANKGKIAEFKKIFEKFNIEAISINDISIEEPEENGKTFEENSIIKAKYYGDNLQMSAVADDSGLSISALDGFPGIYSARWAGKYENFSEVLAKLKLKLEEENITDYSAAFISNITFYDYETKTFHSFEGKVNGKLSYPERGNNGFGYDPIFIPDGFSKTFAEMSTEEKNKISHRGLAMEKFKKWLEKATIL